MENNQEDLNSRQMAAPIEGKDQRPGDTQQDEDAQGQDPAETDNRPLPSRPSAQKFTTTSHTILDGVCPEMRIFVRDQGIQKK